jgi:hypothetical protein
MTTWNWAIAANKNNDSTNSPGTTDYTAEKQLVDDLSGATETHEQTQPKRNKIDMMRNHKQIA